MKKLLFLFVIMVLIASLLTGCKKHKGNPPTLPPEESMTIDFSNFQSTGKSGTIQFPKGVENSNWSFVVTQAIIWQTVISSVLAVPVAAFNYAIDQTPTFVDTNTWQWSFNVTVLQSTFKARLVGQIRTVDVFWQMFITKEGTGAFAEFEWFQGTSKLDGTGGQWTLNHSSAFKEPVLKIDWTRTGTNIGSVTYTYVRTQDNSRNPDPLKNSYITYGKMTGTYNSYYAIHFYDGLGFSDANVEWNSTSKIGHVKCPAFFQDTANPQWHCWDANYANIICP